MKPGDTTLFTPRLSIEPLVAAHAEILFPHFCDPELYAFIPQQAPESLSYLTQRYRRLESRSSPDGSEIWLNWAVRLTGSDDYVGYAQAGVEADGQAMLAYFVFTPYQRQGYAAEMCQRVRDHLISVFAVRSVYALIDTRNQASIALVEKLGFKREAFLPNADYFKDANSDEYRYRYAKSG
ncbi:acetyltransferase family protein [Collimonas arenae]|uniref:Acetyltransferase family protein n=1 Tax=Collimonas arenae TaxID=279058 RepID=A0A127PTS7_9BURK|nr:GNAT family N-acetyltransferase [Collimonas arenae]AMP01193.1 acetyltransferase family protein [Collimonas arenae]AMP11086.1 acetyltransferase family protein [Collimonas arenae]